MQEGIPDEYDVVYVGSLGVEVDPREQDVSGGCACALAAAAAAARRVHAHRCMLIA
jgi:hypothetical protein